MNLTLLRFDWRIQKYVFALGLTTGTALLLFLQGPLIKDMTLFAPYKEALFPFAVLLGCVLGVQCSHEAEGVSMWVATRGFSRQTITDTRILGGFLSLLLCLLLLSLVIALGLRQYVQQASGSGWYPLIRWHELSVMTDVLTDSCNSFSCFVFLGSLVRLGSTGTRGRAAIVGLIAVQGIAAMIYSFVCQTLLSEAGALPSILITACSSLFLLWVARTAYAHSELY